MADQPGLMQGKTLAKTTPSPAAQHHSNIRLFNRLVNNKEKRSIAHKKDSGSKDEQYTEHNTEQKGE
jgi:hypothetical protein